VPREAVRIQGLAEFSRNLKRLDADLPKALRQAQNKAAQLVIDDARPKVPKRSGRAARSMRAASTRTATRVRAGGSRAAYYPWLDFGGTITRGGRGTVSRPFYKDGRFLYRSYYDLRDSGEFERVLNDALLDVARQAGVEIS
jgi:hypothetical protein